MDFPSSPTVGQQYSVSGGPTYTWSGTAWRVQTPGNQFNRTTFTATAGQTVFSVTYTVGAVDVFQNGVKLVSGSDFTATNGTSITLANAATVGDTIEVIAYSQVVFSNALKKTGDTMTGALGVLALTTAQIKALSSPTAGLIAYSTDGAVLCFYNGTAWQKCTATAL